MTVLFIAVLIGSIALFVIQVNFNENRALIQIGFIFYLVVVLLTIMLIGRSMVIRIVIPLKELATIASRVSAGERNLRITELKRTDELGVLSNTFQKMITDIDASNRLVNDLNEELTEKNKDLEQIVYISSHDLRSPLINIQGFNKEILNELKEIREILDQSSDLSEAREKIIHLLDEDIPEAFTYILSSTQKMDLLLNALLKLSRVGRSSLSLGPVDMNQLVAKIVRTFEYQIEEAAISIQIDDLPSCMGDESMIDQVFSNFLSNSIKHMTNDRPGKVRIHGYIKEDETIYCVEDNGIGIDKKYQERIFNLFEKVDIDKAGEGLGLTIIRKIIEKHKGSVWLDSSPNKGSKFFISIPSPK
ncbi:HAMP domain-containing protein [Aquibacillus halophilus]|uniref:histidine kinase n=1 Tax=Aquibacillus halophilus TaxID=930132 RepID=A0A6A8DCJ6_9BACI|nr:ATP-binding protein [Aquibacillus halophilus]MRH41511.1 HAMP domain-containing protein [Aquibacillus halophilus]